MTQTSYQRLFQLSVFHSYFQQDICRCIEFNADAGTAQLLKRFRFMIRRELNGFGLYSNSSVPANQLFQYIEQATGLDYFSFEIRTNNPDFNFFTALPPDWVGQLLYDSNSSTVENNTVQLQQQLSANSGTLCIGKLTLRFADILQYSSQAGFAQFEIRYLARATQWQYYVINKSAVPLNNLAISGKDNIVFDGPKNVVTASGQPAMLFSSGPHLIPLSEESTFRFDLINRQVSGPGKNPVKQKIIIKGLPIPEPQWIGRVTGDLNNQLSSPMYIYL